MLHHDHPFPQTSSDRSHSGSGIEPCCLCPKHPWRCAGGCCGVAGREKQLSTSAINSKDNWYFSWGFSRQQYAPSDIHVSQPSLGNDFTVHQATATDFPTSVEDTIKSTLSLELTNPQENIRLGKFLNPEKTFAIELVD